MIITIEQQLELFKTHWYDLESDTISGMTRKKFDRMYTPDMFDLGYGNPSLRASSAFTFNAKYRPPFKQGDDILLTNMIGVDALQLFKDVTLIIDNDIMHVELDGLILRKNQFNTLFGARPYQLYIDVTYSAWSALLKSCPHILIRNR